MHGRETMLGLTAVDVPTIADLAMERLRTSPYKVLRRISCECKHGVLFLRGRLFSFHEKQVAQEVVAGISGVTQVVKEIQVE
jgi:osmotically-inducible protein OsmY